MLPFSQKPFMIDYVSARIGNLFVGRYKGFHLIEEVCVCACVCVCVCVTMCIPQTLGGLALQVPTCPLMPESLPEMKDGSTQPESGHSAVILLRTNTQPAIVQSLGYVIH